MPQDKRISGLPDASLPIASGVKFEAVQGGINVKVDADDMPGSGGGGLLTTTITNGDTTHAPDGNSVFDALALKVDKESWSTLTDGTTVTWNTDNKQSPLAKLTSTQSFTIDMTNVKNGASGTLKLITNTASAITMTFDSSFTNKMLNTTFSAYVFPALTGQDYFLNWYLDGTTLEWTIGDISQTAPGARLQRAANQSIASDGSAVTAVIWDTANNNEIGYTSGSHIPIPGTGNKRALVTGWIQWDASATGERRWQINKNGASCIFSDGAFGRVPGNTLATGLMVIAQIDCVGGDYLELMQFQNSTTNRNVTAALSISVTNRA